MGLVANSATSTRKAKRLSCRVGTARPCGIAGWMQQGLVFACKAVKAAAVAGCAAVVEWVLARVGRTGVP